MSVTASNRWARDESVVVVDTAVAPGSPDERAGAVAPPPLEARPDPEPAPEQAATRTTTATSAGTRRCTAANGTLAAMGASCDSCGREGDELFAVHRKYVTPESWDT